MPIDNTPLIELKNLGPASVKELTPLGIHNYGQLKDIGAIPLYFALNEHYGKKTHLAFLYAIVGALENRIWLDVAQNDKARLLMEIETYQEYLDEIKHI